jgi:hypothetical protein
MRSTVVFCFHRSLPSRQGRFALRYASLTPLHFALGNAVRGLRKARCANQQEAITEDNEGNKESNEWRGELLRAYDAVIVNESGVAELRPPGNLLIT